MASAKPRLYVNKFTGNIVTASKSQAKHLSEDWERIEFTKNDKGVPVMRLKLNGATVDIANREDTEAALNGNRKSE